jgi:hypothetical protein
MNLPAAEKTAAVSAMVADGLVARALELAAEQSEEARLLVAEDVRLQCAYPAEYVAYMDSWSQCGAAWLLERHVLAHSTSLRDIQDATTGLNPEQRARLMVRYTRDPREDEIETHYDLHSVVREPRD